MISCAGEGMEFSKRPDQSCSMVVTATDADGNISKYGSYVSNTCDNDDNDHFWKIPNVIAIRKKK